MRPDYRQQARVEPRSGRDLYDILDRPSNTLYLLPQDYVVCFKEATTSWREWMPMRMEFGVDLRVANGKTVKLAVPK